jgi:hypothetical protein
MAMGGMIEDVRECLKDLPCSERWYCSMLSMWECRKRIAVLYDSNTTNSQSGNFTMVARMSLSKRRLLGSREPGLQTSFIAKSSRTRGRRDILYDEPVTMSELTVEWGVGSGTTYINVEQRVVR